MTQWEREKDFIEKKCLDMNLTSLIKISRKGKAEQQTNLV